MCISSLATPFLILYFISPWLFWNYFFVLFNSLPSSPIPPTLLPSGNHQNAVWIHDSVSVLLVCLVCFLDSIVDRYVFIAILLFIVWSSFSFFSIQHKLLFIYLCCCSSTFVSIITSPLSPVPPTKRLCFHSFSSYMHILFFKMNFRIFFAYIFILIF